MLNRRMLQRAGVGAGDAAQVSAMVAGAVPLGQIGPGTRFNVELGRREQSGAPRPLEKLAFRARFDIPVPEDKVAKNRIHLDVRGAPGSDPEATRASLEGRGATFLWAGQQGPHRWITMTDPEGNEFCVS